MNEPAQTVNLWHYLTNHEGWGRADGLRAGTKLEGFVRAQPAAGVVRISMQSVKRLDVTFAAEAVIGLAERLRGTSAICLVNLADADLRENLIAAARAMNAPIMAWNGNHGEALGLRQGSALHTALAFAMERPDVRAADFAVVANISNSNASTRLNQLWEAGLLLRTPEKSPGGRAEFVYRVVA